MPKYLNNSPYFDDGAGTHIENGFIECLDLFINQISVEDLIQASVDLIEVEITGLQNQVNIIDASLNGLLTNFGLAGVYVDTNLQALFVALYDLRVQKTLYLYDASNNPFSLNTYLLNNTSNISSINSSISSINLILTGCSRNPSLGSLDMNTDLRILNGRTLYLYDVSGNLFSLNSYCNITNQNISSLSQKTTAISYSGTTTTIANNLVLGTSIDGFTKSQFDNAINMTYDLSSNAQTQIDGAYAAAAAAGAAGIAAGAAASASASAALTAAIAAQLITDTAQDAAISALEGKTQTMTYNVGTNIVNFASKLTANSFGGISCDSISINGEITQTHNDTVTLIGQTYFRNWVNIQYGFGLIIESGDSSIAGNLTCSGGQTNINSTTTQIGTGSGQTLSIYATPSIYNINTMIRNNNTSATGTLSPYLKLLNIATNSNSFKLQGITIGKEQVLNNESNCNLGYNYISDGNAGNYGYLGLNCGTLNTLECLRWTPTKVSISNGNLEVINNTTVSGSLSAGTSTLTSVTTNTINNTGTANLAISSTGSTRNLTLTSANNIISTASAGNIQLNSNTIQIGSNQSASSNNTVTIGSISANSTVNVPNVLYTNTIGQYNTNLAINATGSNSLNLNSNTISIGAGQPSLSFNTITIGSLASASVIYLNGAVSCPLGISTTNIFSQW